MIYTALRTSHRVGWGSISTSRPSSTSSPPLISIFSRASIASKTDWKFSSSDDSVKSWDSPAGLRRFSISVWLQVEEHLWWFNHQVLPQLASQLQQLDQMWEAMVLGLMVELELKRKMRNWFQVRFLLCANNFSFMNPFLRMSSCLVAIESEFSSKKKLN